MSIHQSVMHKLTEEASQMVQTIWSILVYKALRRFCTPLAPHSLHTQNHQFLEINLRGKTGKFTF